MTKFPDYCEAIAHNMIASSEAALKNGTALLEEANILFDHNKFARTVSLAILGEEELAKALILKVFGTNGRWDKFIYQALKSHPDKQSYSRSTIALVKEFQKLQLYGNNLVAPFSPNLEKKAEALAHKAKKEFGKKQRLDKKKQNAQFVKIGKDGKANHLPSFFSKREAAETINDCVRFKAVVENAFGLVGNEHPLLRGITILKTGGPSWGTTIELKSGVDFIIDKSTLTSIPADQELIASIRLFIDFPVYDQPLLLDKDQQAIFAKLLITFNGIDQIKNCMKNLGLRSCQFLDDCERLLAKI